MKKVSLACTAVAVLIACSKKDLPKWWGKPGHFTPSVTCKIDSIYPTAPANPLYYNLIAAGIHYNDQGNPFVVNYTIDGLIPYFSKFSVHYRYDHLNRLIEVDPPEVDPVNMEAEVLTPVLPHKFVYQGNSLLPVRDSILSDTFHGLSNGTPYEVYTVKVEDFTYDHRGRITKVVSNRKFVNTLTGQEDYTNSETRYSYDAKGNRQVIADASGVTPPVLTYTNKPSLYSLHPVWQLVHRNWSNNAAVETVKTYNNKGLPTKTDMGGSRFLQTLNSNTEDPFFNIIYTCL